MELTIIGLLSVIIGMLVARLQDCRDRNKQYKKIIEEKEQINKTMADIIRKSNAKGVIPKRLEDE